MRVSIALNIASKRFVLDVASGESSFEYLF